MIGGLLVMDSARSWFKKFQHKNEKVENSPKKNKEVENAKYAAHKPPIDGAGAGAPSTATKQKVAAAKQYIENHYKSQMKSLQDRKER